MPAIITHDTFGRDVYEKHYKFIGGTRDDLEAYLLGNQGPDPLFYSAVSPRIMEANRLGTRMHREKPSELLVAFRDALETLSDDDYPIGRAYVLGFISHYLLDSALHPLVYGQEYAICDAGVEGLDRSNHHDVHALIESELDELVLTTKRGHTIATFNPSKEILKASDHVLDVISKLYVEVAYKVYGVSLPLDTFYTSVKLFRRIQNIFYSPDGLKRNVMGKLEMTIRPYSFFRAMSHRNREVHESDFENRDHLPWKDPFSGELRTESFTDLYDQALSRVDTAFEAFEDDYRATFADTITMNLNFNGQSVVATILSVEDAPSEIEADSSPLNDGDAYSPAGSDA